MTANEVTRVVNPKKIIMTTDFSENSFCAFRYGATLAKQNAAELILVHVVAEDHFARNVFEDSPMMTEFIDRIERGVRSTLRGVNIPGVGETNLIRRVVRARTPAAGIVECARSEDADLIVMATRGRGVFRQLVMGSSARRVIGTAPCPVLCVKPKEEGMLKEGSDSVNIDRILIPTDISEHSHRALRIGMALARKEGAAVSILFISETQVPPMYEAVGIEEVFGLESRVSSVVLERLKDLVSDVDTHDVEYDIEIYEGQASKEIVRLADELGADLIVISRKGVGDTPHLLGGVTERLLHHAKHPMLVV
jgi:nucleotide-binding universal stress UspA family protein